jgi:hypothetical protein
VRHTPRVLTVDRTTPETTPFQLSPPVPPSLPHPLYLTPSPCLSSSPLSLPHRKRVPWPGGEEELGADRGGAWSIGGVRGSKGQPQLRLDHGQAAWSTNKRRQSDVKRQWHVERAGQGLWRCWSLHASACCGPSPLLMHSMYAASGHPVFTLRGYRQYAPVVEPVHQRHESLGRVLQPFQLRLIVQRGCEGVCPHAGCTCM